MRNGDVTRAFLLALSASLPPYFVAASLLNKLRGSPIALVSYLSCLVPNEATHRFAALIASSSAPENYSLALSLHPSPSSSLGWQHIALRTGVTTPTVGSAAWNSATLRALQVCILHFFSSSFFFFSFLCFVSAFAYIPTVFMSTSATGRTAISASPCPLAARWPQLWRAGRLISSVHFAATHRSRRAEGEPTTGRHQGDGSACDGIRGEPKRATRAFCVPIHCVFINVASPCGQSGWCSLISCAC